MKDKIIFSVTDDGVIYYVNLHFSNKEIQTILEGEDFIAVMEEALKLMKETKQSIDIRNKETLH